MAGTYPDAPGPRIPYDRDGTIGVDMAPGPSSPVTISNANLITMNDEDGDAYTPGGNRWTAFIFPVAIDLTHGVYWISSGGVTLAATQVSTDTTNGVDGTWTGVTNIGQVNSKEALRTVSSYATYSSNGIKAIRFQHNNSFGQGASIISLHLYGKPSATADRLEFWHPTLDQPLSQTPAHFDYADVSRGSGAITKDFRIKNLSSSLTANTITVGAEALSDSGAPTYVSQTEFSYNGGGFGATASLGSLGANTISQVFTVRLTTTASTTLGAWWQRYYATATSWT